LATRRRPGPQLPAGHAAHSVERPRASPGAARGARRRRSLMAEFLENFHFLRPLLLLALVPAVLLFVLLKYVQSRQSAWNQAIEPALLPYLLDRAGARRHGGHLYGLLALWVIAVVALAGPVWQRIPMPVQEREDALVVVADL